MPHSLRLAIFFLRITVGLSFFYLGWTALFNHPLSLSLQGRSVSGLYAWLATPTPIAAIPSAVFAWIFLVAGVCITIGLFTRVTSIIAGILVLASWLPAVSFTSINPAQFINDEAVMLFALVVLIFGRAGHYLGLDTVTRFWKRRK
jgi:uncharacterized membrane protein YphA (DoxX/SURF4 family)